MHVSVDINYINKKVPQVRLDSTSDDAFAWIVDALDSEAGLLFLTSCAGLPGTTESCLQSIVSDHELAVPVA